MILKNAAATRAEKRMGNGIRVDHAVIDRSALSDDILLASLTENNARAGAQAAELTERREGPDVPPEFKGGLGESGVVALQSFLQDGGTAVALNKASSVYATKDAPDVKNVLAGLTNRDFYIPGSILEVTVDPSDPIGFGVPEKLPIFFEGSPAFKVSGNAHSVAGYVSDNPLLSGWILGGKYLKDNSALAVEQVGKGQVVLFGFRPQYRAQSEATYRLFFNALLSSSSSQVSDQEKR